MLSVEICPRSPTEIFRLSFAISFAAAFAVTPRPGRMPENTDATMTMVSTIEITRLGRWFTLCMKCSLLSDSIVLSSSVENAKRLTFAVKKYRPTGQAGILRGFRSRNDPFQLVTALSAHAFPPSAGIFVRYYHTNRLIKPSCRTNGVRSLGAGIPCPARNDERASLLMTSSRILRRSRKTLPTAKRLTNYV